VQLGVALAPDHGIRANGLLSRARLAAQAARQQRPYSSPVAVFEASVEHRQQMRTFVHERLGDAIADDHIEVYYQPIMNARTNDVSGAEALVRWIDPERGLISPAQFIPLAEETGQIVQLGGYVLQRACCEAAGWPMIDGRELTISVNVSAAQIAAGTIVSQVEAALLMSGLRPHRLALEITESSLATHGEIVTILQSLRAKGIRVEIDDFGTGYSSFSYLTRFPVDTVKIDKSFVDRIATGVDDAAITQAIITMAHSLRLTVVAEGIEQEDQAAVLRAQGCDEFQGWLFSKALPPAELLKWLLTKSNEPAGATS
jgi:EAL domain-containing protein (putative c-di-GMP-specific phosphodiesterase class I)